MRKLLLGHLFMLNCKKLSLYNLILNSVSNAAFFGSYGYFYSKPHTGNAGPVPVQALKIFSSLLGGALGAAFGVSLAVVDEVASSCIEGYGHYLSRFAHAFIMNNSFKSLLQTYKYIDDTEKTKLISTSVVLLTSSIQVSITEDHMDSEELVKTSIESIRTINNLYESSWNEYSKELVVSEALELANCAMGLYYEHYIASHIPTPFHIAFHQQYITEQGVTFTKTAMKLIGGRVLYLATSAVINTASEFQDQKIKAIAIKKASNFIWDNSIQAYADIKNESLMQSFIQNAETISYISPKILLGTLNNQISYTILNTIFIS